MCPVLLERTLPKGLQRTVLGVYLVSTMDYQGLLHAQCVKQASLQPTILCQCAATALQGLTWLPLEHSSALLVPRGGPRTTGAASRRVSSAIQASILTPLEAWSVRHVWQGHTHQALESPLLHSANSVALESIPRCLA